MDFSIIEAKHHPSIKRIDVDLAFNDNSIAGFVTLRGDEERWFVFDYFVEFVEVEHGLYRREAISFIESEEGAKAILAHNQVRLYTLF